MTFGQIVKFPSTNLKVQMDSLKIIVPKTKNSSHSLYCNNKKLSLIVTKVRFMHHQIRSLFYILQSLYFSENL